MTLIVGNPGRDRRGQSGDARPDLRSRTPRAVRVFHSVDLHAAPRHPHGAATGRHRDRPAHAAPVAADDEVLEDEPASGAEQLVGADGVAARGAWPVGLEVAQAERPALHMADADVRRAPCPNGSWAQWAKSTSGRRSSSRRGRSCWRRSSLISGAICAPTTVTCRRVRLRLKLPHRLSLLSRWCRHCLGSRRLGVWFCDMPAARRVMSCWRHATNGQLRSGETRYLMC